MDRNTRQAIGEIEKSMFILAETAERLFHTKRGHAYQHMMLNRTLEAIAYRNSQIKRALGMECGKLPRSPLDCLKIRPRPLAKFRQMFV